MIREAILYRLPVQKSKRQYLPHSKLIHQKPRQSAVASSRMAMHFLRYIAEEYLF